MSFESVVKLAYVGHKNVPRSVVRARFKHYLKKHDLYGWNFDVSKAMLRMIQDV